MPLVNNIKAWELILFKTVEMNRHMRDGGLGFLVSLSFYLHFYPQFSDQTNDSYGNDSFHQSNIFHGKSFYTWIFVSDHWISEYWPLKLNELT